MELLPELEPVSVKTRLKMPKVVVAVTEVPVKELLNVNWLPLKDVTVVPGREASRGRAERHAHGDPGRCQAVLLLTATLLPLVNTILKGVASVLVTRPFTLTVSAAGASVRRRQWCRPAERW